MAMVHGISRCSFLARRIEYVPTPSEWVAAETVGTSPIGPIEDEVEFEGERVRLENLEEETSISPVVAGNGVLRPERSAAE
jgi:hypothetical protein